MPDSTGQTVYLVDDDAAVLDALGELLGSVGLACESFADAAGFLADADAGRRGCLVLDIRMPGMSGLELQSELRRRDCRLPIVFITGHGDIPMAVTAMKRGAFEFLQKPFRDQEFLDCVHAALKKSCALQALDAEQARIAGRLDSLTAREREVLDRIVDGRPNKAIAAELGISRRTVEYHRACLMEKMSARSAADLVKTVVRFGADGVPA